MKKIFALLVLVLSICLVSGCGLFDSEKVYGQDGETILVGNTAGQEGALASVGLPFNIGLQAALWQYNNAGGFNGAKVELKNYSDGGVQATGIANTKKLVEEDQVLAMVGHFGSDVVAGTLDYLKDEEVPMVYAASGISALFNAKAEGNDKYIMPIQPIYDGEGQALLARAVATTEGSLGLAGKKVGVIYTNDETGKGLLAGVEAEASKLGVSITKAQTELTGDHSTAVNVIKNASCDVIVLATGNANSFKELLQYLVSGNVSNAKVISSYSNSAAALISGDQTLYAGLMTAGIEVYTSGWLSISVPATDLAAYLASTYAPAADNATGQHILKSYQAFDDTLGFPNLYDLGIPGFTAEYWTVAEAIAGYVLSTNPEMQPGVTSTAFLYSFNSYALAGYIAGATIVSGLKKVAEQGLDLTRSNLVAAMEVGTVDIPMAGEVSFANGARTGVTDIALSKFDYATAQYVLYSDLLSLADVEKGYSK